MKHVDCIIVIIIIIIIITTMAEVVSFFYLGSQNFLRLNRNYFSSLNSIFNKTFHYP